MSLKVDQGMFIAEVFNVKVNFLCFSLIILNTNLRWAWMVSIVAFVLT